MLARAVAVWIAGLLTIVPGGSYYLLFHAQREQYALLIILVLFWVFGFWGVVGPALAALKVRRVFRAIQQAKSRDEVLASLRSAQARDLAIALISSEHRLPRFLAGRVYELLLSRFPVEGAPRVK